MNHAFVEYAAWATHDGIRLFLSVLLGSLLLILLAMFLNKILHRASAATRYSVWFFGFCATMAIPLTLLPIPGIPELQPIPILKLTSSNLDTSEFAPSSQISDNGSARENHDKEFNSQFKQNKTKPERSEVTAHSTSEPKTSAPNSNRYLDAFMSGLCLILVSIWIIGIFVMLARLLISHLSISQLISESQPGQLLGRNVRFCDRVDVPISVGIFRPQVLMPPDSDQWPKRELDVVLRHEFAHVERRDVLCQFVISLAKCLSWFQPLVWMGNRKANLEREIACDNRVLENEKDGHFYAETLLKLTTKLSTSRLPTELALQAIQKPIERRLLFILNDEIIRKRTRMLTCTGVAVFFALGWLTIAMASDCIFQRVQKAEEEWLVGTILDEENRPVADADVQVQLFRLNPDGVGVEAMLHEVTTTTRSDGTYRIDCAEIPVEKSRLYISVCACNADCWERKKSFRHKEFDPGGRIPAVQIKKGRRVKGQITLANGSNEQLVSPMLSVYATPLDRVEKTTTYYDSFNQKFNVDPDGHFEIVVPLETKVSVLATADGYGVGRSVIDETATELGSIELPDGVILKGFITGRDGRTIPNVVVNLREDENVHMNNTLRMVQSSTTTDAQGRFSFPHHHGKCTLVVGMEGGSVFGDGLYPNPNTQPAVLPMSVDLTPNKKTMGVVLRETEMQELSGRILMANGQPAENIGVKSTIMGGTVGVRIGSTLSDSDGNYTLMIPKGAESFGVRVYGMRREGQKMLFAMPTEHPLAKRSSRQSIWFEKVHKDLDDINWTLKEDDE